MFGTRRRRVAASSIVVAAAFGLFALPGGTALGHAPGAVIQITSEVTRPGATVIVNGTGMDPDEPISFELGDATQAVQLGTATADRDGDLTVQLTIPVTVPQGTWDIYARGRDGGAVRTPIVVRGSPPAQSDEQPPPDQDEHSFPDPNASAPPVPSSPAATADRTPTGLAAASDPTVHPGTLPARPAEVPALEPGTPPPPDPGPWLIPTSGGIALVTLLMVALLLRRRQRPSV